MSKKSVVWFSSKGHLLTQCKDWKKQQYSAKSEEAIDFDDRMEFLVMRDGGQTVGRVYLVSASTQRQYSMFLDDFSDAIRAGVFVNNHLEGTFSFVRKGVAQSIKMLLPKDLPTAPWPDI